MKKPGTPPTNASSQFQDAWAIIQSTDRSDQAYARLQVLLDQLPEGHQDRTRIGGLMEAFIASTGE